MPYNSYYNNSYTQPFSYYNPYGMNQAMQSAMQPMNQTQTNSNFKPVILQGKFVDSIDAAKTMDIPLDGSIIYFPITDGTSIVTKQLQTDGTSKTIIYKPVEGDLKNSGPKYITENDFNDKIKDINNKDLKEIKEKIKKIERQIEDISDEKEK